jgi:MoaA/NifB/PqqE/SkfB family radical SAM enzyme
MCKAWRRSWDIQKKTVDEIVAFFPYLRKILWQGGEIFLSEYFEDLFEKAASYPNLRQDINTNGLFINEEWIKRFAKTNICLIYSIDGVTKDIYEYIRGGARFEDLLKSLNLIKEYKERCNFDENKIKTIINVVIMRSNYSQLEQFVDFAYEYKFNVLQLTPIEGEFGSENIFFHKSSQISEYIEKALPQVLNKAKDCGIITFNCLPRINDYSPDSIKLDARNKSCSDSSTEYSSSTRKTGQILCSWPWQNLFIDQWGNVRPECLCREEKPLGNIYKSSLYGFM